MRCGDVHALRGVAAVGGCPLDELRAGCEAGILEGLPLSSDGAIYENVWSSSDLYFLPEDVLKLESILLAVKFIFPEGMRPILQVSNLVLYQATGGSISHWVPYFRVTAKREFRKRSLGQGMIFSVPSSNQCEFAWKLVASALN